MPEYRRRAASVVSAAACLPHLASRRFLPQRGCCVMPACMFRWNGSSGWGTSACIGSPHTRMDVRGSCALKT